MIKLVYIGLKENGKPFRIVNKALLEKELIGLPAGRYRLTIDKWRKEKSNPQLRWLFGQVYPLVLHGLIDVGFEDITTIEEVDAYMKSMFANREIINRNSGEIITVPALKRNFTTVEMMTFTDSIRTWSQEYLNVTIPEPGESYEMNLE